MKHTIPATSFLQTKSLSTVFLTVLVMVLLSSCSFRQPYDLSSQGSPFLSSGMIVLSRQMPEQIASSTIQIDSERKFMSPVLGYIPPVNGIIPAEQDLWLEVDSSNLEITLLRGKERVKTVAAQGTVGLPPGKYALQYKQHFPTWYAPNSYFEKRNITVPAEQDPIRFRKGALGDYALYPTSSFIIHSAPFWSDEVGGLRISRTELADLFSQLNLGSTIVIK